MSDLAISEKYKTIVDDICQKKIYSYYTAKNGLVDAKHNIWTIIIANDLEVKVTGPLKKPHNYKQAVKMLTNCGAIACTETDETIDDMFYKLKARANQNNVMLLIIIEDDNSDKHLYISSISVDII